MYQGKKVGVVVPAYNEEKLIGPTLETIPAFVDRVYIVDDGSTDATPEVIRRYASPRFFTITHKPNRGVGAAIVAGYKKALAEGMGIVVVMAGDNQMDPVQLPNLLAPVVNGRAGYAKGNRLSSWEHMQGMSRWRRFGNWLLTWLTRIACGNLRVGDPQNGYTAITREALERIDLDRLYPYYGYCNDVLVKLCVAGVPIAEVPMPARYGKERSKIKYRRYIPRVSRLLFWKFLWRLRVQARARLFHARKQPQGVV